MSERPSVEQAVQARLGVLVDTLRASARYALLGDADAVHDTRVACRRSRALLPVLVWVPEGDLDLVAGELTWLRRALGISRDAEVITRRLEASGGVPDALAAALVNPPVRTHVDPARVDLLVSELALIGARPVPGLTVSDTLHDWVAPEQAALVRRVQRAQARPTDAAWHGVRRAAKRVRYLAEALEPAYGKPARRLARRTGDLAELLGERQDAAVTRDLLLTVADEPGIAARLSAESEAIAVVDEAFPEAWARVERAWARVETQPAESSGG